MLKKALIIVITLMLCAFTTCNEEVLQLERKSGVVYVRRNAKPRLHRVRSVEYKNRKRPKKRKKSKKPKKNKAPKSSVPRNLR